MIRQSIQRLRLVAKSVANLKFDACDVLQSDHLRIQLLFIQARATRDQTRRRKLFEQIRGELETHVRIEEEIFYPTCESVESLKSLIAGAREEHKQFKRLLHEIEALEKASAKLEPKMKVLMEDVEHHIREEEYKLFPKVRRAFSPDRLEEIGVELRSAKREKVAA